MLLLITQYGIRCVTSQKLIEETIMNNKEYNEVDLLREYYDEEGKLKYLIPNAIICFNEVDEISIDEAKQIQEKFNLEKPLPVIIIHEEFYQQRIKEFKKQILEKDAKNQAEIGEERITEKVERMLEEMTQTSSTKTVNEVLKAIIEAEKEHENER